MPKGGRKASPTLWAMVRGLTEEEWQTVSIMAVMRFKEPRQFRLLKLLRSMEVYDPVAEKAAFADSDLGSMRRTARRWLIRTASKLAFYQTEVALMVMDVDVLLRWGIHDETMEFIAEAKQQAMEQEDFGQLALLYKKEQKAASVIFQGDERVRINTAIAKEAMENGKLVALDAEIDLYIAQFLENARHQLLTTGKLDEAHTQSYFQTEFYRQSIETWPISFQIQKLRLDEGLHYFLGRTVDAAKAAEKLLELIERLEKIRHSHNEDHVRCLFRLSAYYADLGIKDKVLELIDLCRNRSVIDTPIRLNYVRRISFLLFRAAFEFDSLAMANEGLQYWNEHKTILDTIPKDVIRFETLLRICAFHLYSGRVEEARAALNDATEGSEAFDYFTLQAVYKIFHLLILIDENDERGLQSYGKNYKRHIVAYLKNEPQSYVAKVGLGIISILSKASNLEGRDKLRMSIEHLQKSLLEYEKSDDTTYKPYIYPMIKWAELRLK